MCPPCRRCTSPVLERPPPLCYRSRLVMKLIVLGDIHGNLPALEVALREARAEGYDVICHTGDLVGFAPFPDETVERIKAERIPGVRGDIDDALSGEPDTFAGCAGDPQGRASAEEATAA